MRGTVTPVTSPIVASAHVQRAIASLERARRHTLIIMSPLDDTDLATQHDPLMSPIVWDLGHIAAFERLWLLRNIDGPIEFAEMPGTYDPFEHPRATRGALPLPSLDEQRAELAGVRALVEARLCELSFDAGWQWRTDTGIRAPKHWTRDARGAWTARTMDLNEPLDPLKPVCHVCYHEADAYARSVGKRLPTEQEWEAAATWNAETGQQQFAPWGDEAASPT